MSATASANPLMAIGQHCSEPGCRQLDFLPFDCKHCQRIFCLEHRSSTAHVCTVDITQQNVVPQCPLCGQFIEFKRGELPDVKVNEHIASGCKGNVLANVKGKKRKCGLGTCRNPENLSLLSCNACHENFCISHRFPSDHQCKGPATQEQKRESGISRILAKIGMSKEEAKSKPAPAAAAAAAKARAADTPQARAIESLRIKSKAVGDPNVMDKNKWFLEVAYSPDVKAHQNNIGAISMWFDKNWTVGKVVDTACKQLGIENRNNQANAKKLLLFARRLPEPLPFDVPLSMFEPQLTSGDTVTLKFAS